MARRDTRHDGGRLLLRVPVVLVVLLLVAAAASYRFELGQRWLGLEPPVTGPAAVAPPTGLSLPDPADPAPVAAPLDVGGGALDPGRVRRAVADALEDPDLGRRVFAWVSTLDAAAPVLTGDPGAAMPASTVKLLTATAALATLGPDHTFRTVVVPDGAGRIVLVGGGDPFLAARPDADAYPPRADVVTLARRSAAALRRQGVTRVRLGYDDSLFTGPTVSPHWPDDYVPDAVVSPITALWVDGGRPPGGTGRVADPSLAAATAFAAALTGLGVEVAGAPRPRPAPAVEPLAEVESPPLALIVEQVLAVSDNEASEVLAHHVGLATGGSGSFAGGARGVLAALDGLGVDLAGARVYDGSGLSREDRLTPATLAGVLRLAAREDHPELRAVLTGLPVAGFSGSLAERFEERAAPGRGRVRAKTGTLTGVSALAGLVTGRDGHVIVFVLVADRVALEDTLAARDALDAVAAALGACHCGR